jgi:hypothetical protein
MDDTTLDDSLIGPPNKLEEIKGFLKNLEWTKKNKAIAFCSGCCGVCGFCSIICSVAIFLLLGFLISYAITGNAVVNSEVSFFKKLGHTNLTKTHELATEFAWLRNVAK